MASDPVDEILAQWRRERPDLDVSPMGIIGRMTRLAKHLKLEIDKTFAQFGLNPGEFDVLATLRRSGQPYRLSPTELYNSMMVSSGTMTNRIDGLEKVELVRRMPDPNDRRGTIIELTEKGFELIEKTVEAHVANEQRILEALDRSELETFTNLMRKLLISLEK